MTRDLDLVALAALAVVCGAAGVLLGDVPTALTVALAVPLVLVLPGWAAVEALHPAPLGAARWIALAISLSVAVDIVLALLLDRLPSGLTAHSWALALVLATLAGCAVAALRRRHVAGRPYAAAPFSVGVLDLAALAVAAGLVTLAVVIARTPLSASRAQGYTMLWIDPGAASTRTVRVGVQSGELRPQTYRLVVHASGRVVYRRAGVRLAPDQRFTTTIRLAGDVRQARVTARLYRAGDARVFRRVQLVPPGSAAS